MGSHILFQNSTATSFAGTLFDRSDPAGAAAVPSGYFMDKSIESRIDGLSAQFFEQGFSLRRDAVTWSPFMTLSGVCR
jgi:hypothetical protein